MAIRIPKYESRNLATRVGNVDPGFVQPLVNRVGQDANSSTMQSLLDSGKQLGEVAIKEYVSSETARVSEALQDYRSQLSTEKARYTKENQGQNALDAGQHFDSFAHQAASTLAGKFDGKFRDMFTQHAGAYAVNFMDEGQTYAAQQEKLWKKTTWEGDLAQTLNEVAANPDKVDYARDAFRNLKSTYMGLFPGMDYRGVEAELNQKFAGAIIDSHIAKDQFGAAREVLNQYRDMLGSDGSKYEMKINTKGREFDDRAQQTHMETVKGLVMSGDMQGAQDYMNTVGIAPRGIRNNNPGNIVRTSGAWEGEVAGQDAKFKSFATPEQGIAAVGRNLLSYEGKGLNTISGIINRWAPPSENNTSEYVSTVSKAMGVSPDAKLDMKDPAVLTSLTRAIIKHENGQMPYSDEQMQAGVDAALGKRKLSTAAGDMAKPAPAASEPGSGNLTPYSQSVLLDWIDKYDKKRMDAHDDAYGRTLAQNVMNGKADAEDVQTRLREELSPARAEKVWNGFQSEMTNAKEARDANAHVEGLQSIAKAKEMAKNPNLDFKSVNAFLADVGEDNKGYARSKKILQQALVQQNKMNMPKEVTDPSAKTAARAAINNGMSYDSVEMQYGARLSSSDLDDLQTFAGSKELQKANRKATAFFDEMVMQSGLNVHGDNANQDDKLYLSQKKAEFEEMVANNEFKSRDDQKAWIYTAFAKRTKPGMIWDSHYTPREAQGKTGAYVPVPDYLRESIKRALAKENTQPTEENIQAMYQRGLETRGF